MLTVATRGRGYLYLCDAHHGRTEGDAGKLDSLANLLDDEVELDSMLTAVARVTEIQCVVLTF